MGLIFRPPWTRQPGSTSIGLDRGNALARTITTLIPFNGIGRDVVTGSRVTIGSAGSIGADARGLSLRAAGGAAAASIPLDLSAYDKLTLSFWLYWDAFANDDALAMEFTSNANGANGFYVDPNSSGGSFEVLCGASGAISQRRCSRPTAAAWHHIAVLMDRSVPTNDVQAIYIDGVEQSLSTVIDGNPAGNFANDTLYLFSRNNSALFAAGRLQNLTIRGGYLMGAAEVQEEYLRPWQVFARQPRRLFARSAAANQSIAVPAGSLTLTGRTPTVSQTAHQSIAVPAGALTLTGFAPAISANQSIAVPAGALTLTGLVPTVTSGANQAISVPAGALSLTGNAPSVTLTDHQSISVPAGSLSLSGLAPSVTTTDHQSIAVPVGALTLTGFAPEIGGAQQIIVPAGTLTLTGYEPTVLDGSQVRQVPGGGRVRAVVNGRRFEGTRAELAMLLRKLAEEHAEEDDDRAEEGKPPKKRVIRLKSAEKATVETAPRTQAETTRIELPASVRESIDLAEADEIYREAYARRVAIQQDDDDVMQLAEQYRQKRIAAVQSLAKIIEKLRP